VPVPGFSEVDLVAHSGHRATGEFACSLNLTDLQTSWTETRAVLGQGETAVVVAFEDIQAALPIRLLGIGLDNGSEFIDWHLGRWGAKRQIQFTRSRPSTACRLLTSTLTGPRRSRLRASLWTLSRWPVPLTARRTASPLLPTAAGAPRC
jgi:hypothetical protein